MSVGSVNRGEWIEGLVVNMCDRLNTIVCIFDPRSPRISAFNIHEWIHDNLRLVEEDTWSVQKVTDLNFSRINKSSTGSIHHCRCGGDIYAHA